MPGQFVSFILASLWVFALGSILMTLYRWIFDSEGRLSKEVVSRINFAIPVLGTLNLFGFGVLVYSYWTQWTSGVGAESMTTLVVATAVWGIVYLFSHILLPQLFWIPAMRRIPALSLAFLIPIALTPIIGAFLLNSLFDWYPEWQFGFAIGFTFRHVGFSLVALGVILYILYKDEQRKQKLKKHAKEEDVAEEDSPFVEDWEMNVEEEVEEKKPKRKKKGKKKDKKKKDKE